MIWHASQGLRVPAIAQRLNLSQKTVRQWLKRFNVAGPGALEDAPRSGRPATYTPELVGAVSATALTPPKELGLGFGSWTLDRLETYLNEQRGIPIKRSRWMMCCGPKGYAGASRKPGLASGSPRTSRKKGLIERLYTDPPAQSVVVCLDEMGAEASKSCPGQQVVAALAQAGQPVQRAKQEIDYGRRGKGDVFGAFRPATGEAWTEPYARRTTANGVDFLERVEAWVDSAVERVDVILDNLSVHRATDVLVFSLAHPRWEVVFQPRYAAYLNLIEPWEQVCQAIRQAMVYWNKHRPPFVWGRRRRHQPRRPAGVALAPNVTRTCRMNHLMGRGT